MRKIKKIILIIILFLVFSGCSLISEEGLDESKKEDIVKNEEKEKIIIKNDEFEEVDISNWYIYEDNDLNYEVKYPNNFEQSRIIGGYSRGQEYPKMGVIFYNSENEQEDVISLYDKEWMYLTDIYLSGKPIDFRKDNLLSLKKIKEKKEFNGSSIVKKDNLEYLRFEQSNSLILIINKKGTIFIFRYYNFNIDNKREKEELLFKVMSSFKLK